MVVKSLESVLGYVLIEVPSSEMVVQCFWETSSGASIGIIIVDIESHSGERKLVLAISFASSHLMTAVGFWHTSIQLSVASNCSFDGCGSAVSRTNLMMPP